VLGALYAQNGTLTCVVASFQTALPLDAESWEGRSNLGLALIMSTEDWRAVDEHRTLRRMASKYPNSVEVHFNLPSAFTHHLQHREAAAEYKKTVRLEPGNATALLSLAEAILNLDDLSAALPCLQNHLRQQPGNPDFWERSCARFASIRRLKENSGSQ
jgi:predicted Zn-dependent protease